MLSRGPMPPPFGRPGDVEWDLRPALLEYPLGLSVDNSSKSEQVVVCITSCCNSCQRKRKMEKWGQRSVSDLLPAKQKRWKSAKGEKSHAKPLTIHSAAPQFHGGIVTAAALSHGCSSSPNASSTAPAQQRRSRSSA